MHDSVMAWVGGRVQGPECHGTPVLEVGSYNVNGSVRALFGPLVYYTGVDVVDGPGVDIVIDPVRPLPFRSEQFGVVVSTECLEHAERPWFTIAEMARVAASGAPVLVTARGWIVTNRETGEVATFGWHNAPDLWRFSGEAMRAMAEAAGLVVVEIVQDPQVPGWFMHATKP